MLTALLAFFIGGFGAHWFYLGERGRGMARLLVSLGAGLLYVVGYIIAAVSIAAGGTGALGGILFALGLIGLLVNQILVIIDLVKILTDNW